jgi:hypothetical protein
MSWGFTHEWLQKLGFMGICRDLTIKYGDFMGYIPVK